MFASMVAHTYSAARASRADELTALCIHGLCVGIRGEEFDNMSTWYMVSLCSVVILGLIVCTLVGALSYSLVLLLIETLPRKVERRQTRSCVYSSLTRWSPLRMWSKEMDSGCAICLDSMGTGSIVRQLPCKHSFHASCIDEWLLCGAKVAQCPLCLCAVGKKCTGGDEEDAESIVGGCV